MYSMMYIYIYISCIYMHHYVHTLLNKSCVATMCPVSIRFPLSQTKQVQEQVVALLAARLNENQDTDAIIHLLHSLGNTGSKAAVRVLLEYLKEEDLNVQLAAIPSLRMHISSEKVQTALTQLLEINKNEEVGFICVHMHAAVNVSSHPLWSS